MSYNIALQAYSIALCSAMYKAVDCKATLRSAKFKSMDYTSALQSANLKSLDYSIPDMLTDVPFAGENCKTWITTFLYTVIYHFIGQDRLFAVIIQHRSLCAAVSGVIE